MRSLWLLGALVLSALLAAFHVHALQEYLYWRNVWLDVPVHFVGGFTIGIFLAGFLIRFRPFLFLTGFFAVAVAWEVFEYYFGVPRDTNYIFDTTLDLLTGFLGALAAYVLARFTLWRN